MPGMLDSLSTPVAVKWMESFRVAYVRHVGPWNDVGLTFLELARVLRALGIRPRGPFIALHEESLHTPSAQTHVEAAAPVPASMRADRGLLVKVLPAADVASLIYDGPPTRLPEAFQILDVWVRDHGCVRTGPYREIHAPDLSELPPGVVHAEIQVPMRVRKPSRP